jgi:hypothetical protein
VQVEKAAPADVHKIIDKLALDRQSITGESYAKAYTEIYTDPRNRAFRDGTAAKAAAPVDPRQDYVGPGPAHARMHSMAIDFQRANPRHSYESAYSRVYTAPENAGLRAENREHLAASMTAAHG